MNGCSWFPRMRMRVEDCCNQHDEQYSKASTVSRSNADANLLRCIWKQSYFYAVVVYLGVRCFGWMFYKRT